LYYLLESFHVYPEIFKSEKILRRVVEFSLEEQRRVVRHEGWQGVQVAGREEKLPISCAKKNLSILDSIGVS